MKVVTIAKLVKLNACDDALAAFRDTFGRSMTISPANLTKASRVLSRFSGGEGPFAWLVNRTPALQLRFIKRRVKIGLIAHNGSVADCPNCQAAERIARKVLLESARG